MTPLLTVPMPTVDGREHDLERAIRSYQETWPNVEIIVVRNAPCCGVVWQYGAETGTGDYIMPGADDLEVHPGAIEAAIRMIDQGALPAPLIRNTDGTVQSCGGTWGDLEPDHAYTEFTRAPIFSRHQWETAIRPMIPTHYYTDNWVTYRGLEHGIPTVVCHGYELTHHMAEPGRGAGLSCRDRMSADHRLFQMYASGQLAIPEGDAAWQPTSTSLQRLAPPDLTPSTTSARSGRPQPAPSPATS